MKTLSDWLASSSSSSESGGDPPVARGPTTETFLTSAAHAEGQPPALRISGSPSARKPESFAAMHTRAGIAAAAAPVRQANLASAHVTDNSNNNVSQPIQQQPPPHPHEVVVMVVDRGTQTVTTVGTQTDDVVPPYTRRSGRGMYTRYDAGGDGYDGVARGRVSLLPHGRLASHHATDTCRDHASTTATALYEQLQLIENYIDTLITRYNLPPLPMPE